MEKSPKQKEEFYKRFKQRVAHRARQLEARKQASLSQAKLAAMPPATKSVN